MASLEAIPENGELVKSDLLVWVIEIQYSDCRKEFPKRCILSLYA
jgi:hypothetical protein